MNDFLKRTARFLKIRLDTFFTEEASFLVLSSIGFLNAAVKMLLILKLLINAMH